MLLSLTARMIVHSAREEEAASAAQQLVARAFEDADEACLVVFHCRAPADTREALLDQARSESLAMVLHELATNAWFR